MQSDNESNDPKEVFDFDTASRLIPGGPEAVMSMAKLLIVEVPKSLQQIHDGLDAEDAPGVRRAAHTLKGSADLFGATSVVEAAWRIEQLAEQDQLNDVQAHIAELETEVVRLVSAVQAEIDRMDKS